MSIKVTDVTGSVYMCTYIERVCGGWCDYFELRDENSACIETIKPEDISLIEPGDLEKCV